MAENKQAMGNDPLAWLAQEGELDAVETAVEKNAVKNRKKTGTDPQEKAEKTDTEIVEQSFAQLAGQGELLVTEFYDHLFLHNPELKPLFEGVSAAGQQKKLLAALMLLVNNLRKPAILQDYLKGLGNRHQSYGVRAEDYEKVKTSLLSVMRRLAGENWTDAVETAWRNTLNAVVQQMLGAYDALEESEMAVTSVKQENDFINVMAKALDGAVTAIMMVDRDFTITYANRSTLTMLSEHEATLKNAFPGFSVRNLVGSNIDAFHKNPKHQRQLLSDPDNLPYTADIKVGPLSFRLNVTGMFDNNGAYVGNMLEWHNVTEEKLRNADIHGQFEALNKVMGVISFNMDGTVLDINDNFLDVVGYSRDEVIGKHHRMFAEPELANSPAYAEFWAKLNRGEFDSGEYKRIAKDGREIWLQASYNPVLDLNGKPYKVVKYAADITEQKQLQITVQSVLESSAVVMNAMAEGDLTKLMEGDYEGEFAQLQQAINGTVNKMSSVVQDITEAAINISAAASEISQGNVDLSQRTEEQASSLEETASSMEELTSTVRQNSDNARQANQLAVDACEKAEKGGAVIQNAIQAMAAISASSKKVADIIGVIDEIAFQTNLLALNAAVEAARAGEQGRGFAVVASEVRNLAQRSAAAAKEIKELINDSGEKVKEGSALVDESGKTLQEIVEGAKKVGDIISEIAAAGLEQTSGIEQVNKAVTQMDEMTQQNAALVEEAAAASESLDEQGQNLQQMMAFFDTGREMGRPPQQAPASARAQTKARPAVSRPERPLFGRHAPARQDDDEWDEF
ncbi:methyl-accepting chemotaxis protein [Methylophaga sp.]|jgi:methyl-accepting chemotaxis protein|uniref:methyl-accepting chemotaxis protein n=1 Tax=Methylophaga sp. TaxID=2024840 RepID=UPI0013FF2B33|nr:methyl-accepting chemotaxis protein [Methylophaga sp.]MTI63780.1 PAS domain S-box protein [Methylophaga sp.]